MDRCSFSVVTYKTKGLSLQSRIYCTLPDNFGFRWVFKAPLLGPASMRGRHPVNHLACFPYGFKAFLHVLQYAVSFRQSFIGFVLSFPGSKLNLFVSGTVLRGVDSYSMFLLQCLLQPGRSE